MSVNLCASILARLLTLAKLLWPPTQLAVAGRPATATWLLDGVKWI